MATTHIAYADPLLPLEYLVLLSMGGFYFAHKNWAPKVAAAVYLVLLPVTLWVAQFEGVGKRSGANPFYVVNAALAIAVTIGVLVWLSTQPRFRPGWAALISVFAISQLLQFFSFVYWRYGDQTNFNHPLTHLDSFYFAVGTLTTAGTGNISAVSETARRIQTLQMLLGLSLLAV